MNPYHYRQAVERRILEDREARMAQPGRALETAQQGMPNTTRRCACGRQATAARGDEWVCRRCAELDSQNRQVRP